MDRAKRNLFPYLKYKICTIAIYCVVCEMRFNDAGVKKIVFSDNLANAEGRKKDSKTVVNSHVGLFACNYFFLPYHVS